jgi:hypothetical protein
LLDFHDRCPWYPPLRHATGYCRSAGLIFLKHFLSGPGLRRLPATHPGSRRPVRAHFAGQINDRFTIR